MRKPTPFVAQKTLFKTPPFPEQSQFGPEKGGRGGGRGATRPVISGEGEPEFNGWVRSRQVIDLTCLFSWGIRAGGLGRLGLP